MKRCAWRGPLVYRSAGHHNYIDKILSSVNVIVCVQGAAKYIPVSIVDVLDEGLHGMTSILKLSPATSLWSICPLVGHNFEGFSVSP